MPQEAITDCLPIHTSDSATFKQCRRKWNWTSPMRANLRPKVSYAGISFPLAFGTAIHSALEHHYTLMQIEQGEHITPEAAEEYLTTQASISAAQKFQAEWEQLGKEVTRINEAWMMENAAEFDEHMDLGIGMMNYYTEWANENDRFEVVNTEHLFSVDTGLTAKNERTGSVLPVHYRGRMDMVVRDRATGRYGILDHKTSATFNPEAYLEKLDMDEQVTRYVWAAQKEAEQSNGVLPYTTIDFVYYNVLWKGYPKPPTITTRGYPSIARTTEFTTLEMFRESILGNKDREIWYKTNPKAQEYADYLRQQGSERFVKREVVYRNQQEIVSAGDRILLEIQDMLAPDLRIYPNPTSNWSCLKCSFRSPCLAAMDGSDVDYMLDIGYEQNMSSAGEYTTVPQLDISI